VTTFLFATFENYTILSNTLHHLGKRPDLQRRLRQEWAQAFADRNPRSLEELWSGLRLAKDVVKESLRLSVVGAQTWRVTDEECPIGIPSRRCAHTGPVGGGAEDFGHNGLPAAALAAVSGAGGGAGSGRGKGREVVLPKGTSIIIPMVSIHRNPK
jgi:cytochrome P450